MAALQGDCATAGAGRLPFGGCTLTWQSLSDPLTGHPPLAEESPEVVGGGLGLMCRGLSCNWLGVRSGLLGGRATGGWCLAPALLLPSSDQASPAAAAAHHHPGHPPTSVQCWSALGCCSWLPPSMRFSLAPLYRRTNQVQF